MAIVQSKRSNQLRNPSWVFQKELNSLLSSFLGDSFLDEENFLKGVSDKHFFPQIDIADNEKSYVVSAELPGLNAKDIDISLDKNILSIRGEKKSEHTEKNEKFIKTERQYGEFYREIELPNDVDEKKVTAKYQNGLLSIEIEKDLNRSKQAKKISIANAS